LNHETSEPDKRGTRLRAFDSALFFFVWFVLFVVKMLRLWFFHFLAFAGRIEHQLDLIEFGRAGARPSQELPNRQQIKNPYRNERGPISGLLSAAFWFFLFVWFVIFVVKMLRFLFFHFLAFAWEARAPARPFRIWSREGFNQ